MSHTEQLKPLAKPLPYTRLDTESQKAYEAFALYRDMGIGRSLESVSQSLSKSVPLLKRWSSQHSWVERAEVWDAEQEEMRRQEAIARQRQEYRQLLKEYQKNNFQLGKAAFKSCAQSCRQIIEFLDQEPGVNSWEDANRAASVIKMLIPVADLWARSLAVEKLLDQMDTDLDA